uniref:Uncharacterized protein n=1 Tax=Nymphaea colorata TaxID=210225 RepID=A0A5K1H902_9MAGN|nr:unnamed protein product [Nymphaea colorata]
MTRASMMLFCICLNCLGI